MPTSYTSLLGLALPVTGELAGTWGDTVNNYITSYVDASVAGTQTISGSQTAVTLSVTNGSSLVTAGSGATGSAQFQIINCTGNPGGLLTITAPASSRQYIIINATSTNQSVKIVGAGPTTGVTLVAGEKAHVAWNGSDFVKIATQNGSGDFVTVDTTNLEVTNIKAKDGTASMSIADSTGVVSITANPVLSGGTANGVLYLDGSKVATSGSALTFDGTNFTVGGGGGLSRFNVSNNGAGGFELNPDGLNNGPVLIAYNRGNFTYRQLSFSGSPLVFQISGSELMRLNSTSLNIGGNFTSTNNTLQVTGNAAIGYTTAAPTTGLIVAGNVGIGTDSPQRRIHGYIATGPVARMQTNGSNAAIEYVPGATDGTGSIYNWVVGAQYNVGNTFEITPSTAAGNLTFSNPVYAVSNAGLHKWYNGTTQAMTLDALGNLLVGTTTTTNNLRLGAKLAVVSAGTGAFSGANITAYSGTTATSASFIDLNRSRGNTDGSMTVVANGDALGYLVFRGSDGASFLNAAEIYAQVDGTPGTNDMPGRLIFTTTADGASSPTERARISSDGTFRVKGAGTAGSTDAVQFGGGAPAQSLILDSIGRLMVSTTVVSTTYNALTVAGTGITIADDGSAKLQIGRYSAGFPNSYIKLGPNSSSLRFSNAADTADLFELTNSGNLGLGVTPSAWRSGTPAFQIGSAGVCLFADSGIVAGLGNNMFLNSSSQYIYLRDDLASRYQQYQGVHSWLTAGSGTAGNQITFTTAMTLDASGNLGIGATSPTNKLQVISGATSGFNVSYDTAGNNRTGAFVWTEGSSDANFAGGVEQTSLGVYTARSTSASFTKFTSGETRWFGNTGLTSGNTFTPTERARITSSGYFKASDNGTYNTGTSHNLRNTASNDRTLIVESTASSLPYGILVLYTAAAPNGTASEFLDCQDTGGQRAAIRSNGGLANYQSNNVDLSDIRTKTDISPLSSYWNKIAALEIVTYKYKDQTHDDLNIGVIAQQVEQVAPEFVDPDGFGETPEDGVPLKTIYNKDLTFAAIKALQEAMARIEQLEAKVAALEAK